MSNAAVWLTDRVATVPNLMSGAECEQLITLAESVGFEAAGVRTAAGQQSMPQVRNNDRCLVTHPEWTELLWRRLDALGLPALDGDVPTGLPEGLRFYRYQPGQRFKMHKDGPWHENGKTSRLTVLVYLNHGYEGGSTDFRAFAVQPQEGMGLLFVHDTWHEGTALIRGTKYVLRSDLFYGPGRAS